MPLPLEIQNKIDKRQEANREIIKVLTEVVERCPDLRFGQILYAVNAIKQNEDPFYIESVDMLNRIKNPKKF